MIVMKDIADSIADSTGAKKSATLETVALVFDHIKERMNTGDEVFVSGFGKFITESKQARIGRNPATGAEVQIPAKTVPKFKPAKALKDYIN